MERSSAQYFLNCSFYFSLNKNLCFLYFYSFIFFLFLITIFQFLNGFQTQVSSTAKLEI